MPNTKLTNDQRMLVLRLFAEGISSTAIVKELLEEHGVKICQNAIIQTCKSKKHQPRIKEFKDRYLSEVRSVPIANKRIRIDDLEEIKNKIMKMLIKNPLKTKSDRTEFLAQSGRLMQIEAQAMEEMEKKPHIFQNVVVTMGDSSDEALHERRKELENRWKAATRGRTTGANSDSGGVESEDKV